MGNIQEKNVIQDILKALLLSKQQIQGQYGLQETPSIFETILNNFRDKFKIDEKLLGELQIEFTQYARENKEKLIEKASDGLVEKVSKINYYDLKNIIVTSETLRKIVEEQMINSPKIQEAINEIVNRDFPELSRKIKEGKIEIKINVNLK